VGRANHRRKGLGLQLIKAFEARARAHGCASFFLETFNFQAPDLYMSMGYEIAYENTAYPHGIVKYQMVKRVVSRASAA
jgi:ribosomal protein S18 acetylase RimI-like enzyme